ncbi:MAG: spheroidene monooxygenase [Labrys sp. (in: a-proteobacteria)]
MQAISLSVFRFDGFFPRMWAFSQMGLARAPLRRMTGIGFFKLFGTGSGEGFTPIPNLGVYAILATWPSLAEARAAVEEGRVFRRYRQHASEHCTVYLSAITSRGAWDGAPPFAVGKDPAPTGPIAVLTRATVKRRHLIGFWRHTPDISATVRDQDHLLFKIGLGEVPWLQQVTFSIWDDAEAMKAFAYRSAAHATAIRHVREGGYFKEELYARFRVLASDGRWQGHAVLPTPGEEPARAA